MMQPITTQKWNSPVGSLIIGSHGDSLCLCDWEWRKQRQQIDRRIQQFFAAPYVDGSSVIIDQVIAELAEYFAGQRQSFDVRLSFAGSDFQMQVWQALMAIPFGETRSYSALAQAMNKESAIRAVAAANGANALSIFVPCHRIIGQNGDLVGYAGGLGAKKKLLALEGSNTDDRQQMLEFDAT